MVNQLTWKIGGQQGEGIESAGQILAKTLTHAGYFLYGIRSFSSRIKGGATNNRLRISTTPVGAISDFTNLMLAFDQDTWGTHADLHARTHTRLGRRHRGQRQPPVFLSHL